MRFPMGASVISLLPLLLFPSLVESFPLPPLLNHLFGNNNNQGTEPEHNIDEEIPHIEKKEPFYKAEGLGQWRLFKENSGVNSMHLVINHHNKAVFFDSTIYNPSGLQLPQGEPCRKIPGAKNGEVDCWAHAAEMDIDTGDIRPLKVLTDTWCSSGGFDPNGNLVQTGGWRDGGRVIRYLDTCDDCDWREYPNSLSGERWYSTQVMLADGSFVVIGGRNMFNYEYVPPPGQGNPTNLNLPFLQQTNDKVENNLYPFAYLSTDGNIFLFANNRAILFDPKTGKTIRAFPRLKGGSRNYPASGMSVLLPIDLRGHDADTDVPIPAEVLVCGGSQPDAFTLAEKKQFPPALKTCGRISITNPNDVWHMEEMPMARTVSDMLILPNTEVLIINGASKGCAGWDYARDAVLEPVLYHPYLEQGEHRFSILKPSQIPRVYHSTAAVLPDATVLVMGSNTNFRYSYEGVLFPTEMRVEKFYPPYLEMGLISSRPTIMEYTVPTVAGYGMKFSLGFSMPIFQATLEKDLMVTMYSPPFTTHGFSMNQRLVVLKAEDFTTSLLGLRTQVTVTMPPSAKVAPPGYYMLFVVNKGVPSKAVWIELQSGVEEEV